jgi:predicted RNA-binding Zn-ribbon protein involved in translation (DUF1610 family)
MKLSHDKWRQALAIITSWRLEPETAHPCPHCGASGLAIEDRSARPHAEWYHLHCTACGLSDTIHIPLAPPAAN